jgi:putative NADPH-quinone reductase
MRISVILAHPDEESFNHSIAQTAIKQLEENGHEIFFHDLYKESFDPLLTCNEIPKGVPIPQAITEHCRQIAQAEGIIIVHPNWWGQPPAILKGWVDRVIRPGIAYEFLDGDSGEGVPKGLLRAEAAIVYNTSNTGAEREKDVFGDPLDTIWRNCIFGLCGITNFYRRTFSIVVTSTEAERKKWLEIVRGDIDTIFPRKDVTKAV